MFRVRALVGAAWQKLGLRREGLPGGVGATGERNTVQDAAPGKTREDEIPGVLPLPLLQTPVSPAVSHWPNLARHQLAKDPGTAVPGNTEQAGQQTSESRGNDPRKEHPPLERASLQIG